MQKQYQLRGKVYTIADCSESEIPSHLERVSSYWGQYIEDLSTQIPRLKQCIDEGIAVKMLDENDECQLACYLLYSPRDRVIVLGQYFWVTSNRCMAMLFHWLKYDKKIAMVFFMPFNMNPVPFQKVVEDKSIRRHNSFHTPLKMDFINGKASKFIDKYFTLYDIKELSKE